MWYDALRPHVWLLRAVPVNIQRRIAAYARVPDRKRRSPTAAIASDIIYTEVEEGAVILTKEHVFFVSKQDLTHIPQIVRQYWTNWIRLSP